MCKKCTFPAPYILQILNATISVTKFPVILTKLTLPIITDKIKNESS